MIRTPDQRLRVFVSSTIQELAPERAAVRRAIESLRLSPVMFELGSRPHPPRDLYRAYLAQSDIFLGIYWQSYGWVAPSMEISGLDDEWRLSDGKPRLVYIKEPAPDRDPRLRQMLDAASDSVAYRRFSTPGELADLVADDLALLLSERFGGEDTGIPVAPGTVHARPRPIPLARGRIVGRADDITRLERDIVDRSVRLLTLTGAGGTGKTRLAIEVGRRAARFFDDGACFISLGEVSDPSGVAGKVARDLGLQDAGLQAVEATILEYLADKDMLLVVDNFEHVLDAAPLLADVVEAADRVSVLVTSRAPLRLTVEREHSVDPLPHPEGGPGPQGVLAYPSVELFIDRARQANPDLTFDDAQLEAIGEITRALDGLPLAIELAAARTRLLDPRTLAGHMGNTLDLLGRGARDLPRRQQTMRAAIAWSERLLDDDGRRVFRRMSVFNGDATLEAVQQVTAWDIDGGIGVVDVVESLVDVGLVRATTVKRGEGRLSMLKTVGDYARERLAESGEQAVVEKRHAEHYLAMVEEAAPYLWLPERDPWMDYLGADVDNLRTAMERLAAWGETGLLWRMAAAIGPYLTIREAAGEALRFGAVLHLHPDTPCPDGVGPQTFGTVMRDVGTLLTFVGDFATALPMLRRAVTILDEAGDAVGAARTLAYLGIAGISTGEQSALADLQAGLDRGTRLGDLYSSTLAGTFLAEVSLAFGDTAGARRYLADAQERSRTAGDRLLEGLACVQQTNIAIVVDDMEEAIAASSTGLQLLESVQASVVGWPMIGLAYCQLRVGEVDVAAKSFDRAVEFGRRVGDKSIVAMALVGLAGVTARQGDAEKAPRLLGAADAIIESSHYQMWSSGRTMYDLVERAVRDLEPAEAMASRRSIGRGLTYEEAIALAAL